MGELPERPKVPGVRDNFGRGNLLVLDLRRVDAAWNERPAAETLHRVRENSFAPSFPDVPGRPQPADGRGLDVALEELTLKRLLQKPLAENLRARRSLGAPWKWFTTIPDRKAEMRADERLLRQAEATRLPDLGADEVMAVASVAERQMIGAKEVRAAFERWADPGFATRVGAVRDEEIPAILAEAWGDVTPLAIAMGVDEESELVELVRARFGEVRAVVRFAQTHGLSLVPATKESWSELLDGRAAARAS